MGLIIFYQKNISTIFVEKIFEGLFFTIFELQIKKIKLQVKYIQLYIYLTFFIETITRSVHGVNEGNTKELKLKTIQYIQELKGQHVN